MARTGRATGVVAIAITAILWGTTGTAATFAPGVGPLAIGSFALGIGGILQAAIALPVLRAERAALTARWPLVAIGAAGVAVYPLAFYSSMDLAGVAIGSVASLASAPLASGVLERVVDGRALSRRWRLAAALGVLGSVLLCAAKLAGGEASPTGAAAVAAGIGLGVVAGASYATYSWVAHTLIAGGASRGAAMGSVFGLGGLALIPVFALTGSALFASWQNAAVGAYMALVPMFVGYVLFGYGLTRVTASTATTVTLLEPAVAAVLAVVIVGEALSPLGWVGLGIIAAVLVLLVTEPDRVPAPAARATAGGDGPDLRGSDRDGA
ncbi:DMT family transporter [Microbacterium sp. ZXX196]|uniref:DMT family transporter n=1 Tax=Microbacterium sp. ZXX196 TaxID=2609291 RepID=UPI0012B7240B|nr:EamA family transporter [Microbacterium sp. ZXX196]MTE22990.1 EamA family transporter [Microbacterium sp. ZXX196]